MMDIALPRRPAPPSAEQRSGIKAESFEGDTVAPLSDSLLDGGLRRLI